MAGVQIHGLTQAKTKFLVFWTHEQAIVGFIVCGRIDQCFARRKFALAITTIRNS